MNRFLLGLLAATALSAAAHAQAINPGGGGSSGGVGCTVAGTAGQAVYNDGSTGCLSSAATLTAGGRATFPAAGALSASAVNITGAPIASGGSGTTTFPLVYLNSGTAPTTFSTAGTVLGINAPSGFTGNLLDLHVNGGASLLTGSAAGLLTSGGGYTTGGNNSYSWSARGILTSSAAGNVQLGNLDAAAPVAQTLSAQSVVAPTSNTAGANLVIQGSRSTGSGASGDVDIAVAPSSASATVQNTAASAFKVSHLGVVRLGPAAGYIVSGLPASPPTGSRAFVTDQATACPVAGAALIGSGLITCPVFYNGTAWVGD